MELRAPVVGTRPAVSLAVDVRALVDLVADEELEIVDERIDRGLRVAFREVLARWPVRTGRSRRELVFVRAARLSWGARGDAPYTGAIVVRGERAAESLLREPIVEALDTAIRTLGGS